MGEDMLVLVLKLARVNEERNRLGVDDYAVLQCVSKNVAAAAKDIVDNKECVQKAWRNTAFFMGYDSDFAIKSLGLGQLAHCRGEIPRKGAKAKAIRTSTNDTQDVEKADLLVNAEVVLRTFIRVRRLLYTINIEDRRSCSKTKLVELVNELTSKVAQNIFVPQWQWSISSQCKTIKALMNLVETRITELRVLSCFFTFYFISLSLKLGNVPDNILSHRSFRDVVIARTASAKDELRNKITMVPFGFSEKMIRLMTTINSKLRKW